MVYLVHEAKLLPTFAIFEPNFHLFNGFTSTREDLGRKMAKRALN